MIRTQVYLPEDLYKTAKATAQLQKTTISKLIRQGLEIAVNQKTEKQSTGKWLLKNFAGKGNGKDGVEAAVNHNDIYDHII